MNITDRIDIVHVPAAQLKPADYNPRKHSDEQAAQLKESISRFGLVDPIICNRAPGRDGVVIGGHFRLEVAKSLGIEEVPVVYVSIPNIEREKELNLRLNKNVGEFDLDLLAEFDESFLKDVGFSSEELDDVFPDDEGEPEEFDLAAELARAGVEEVTLKAGDVLDLGGSRLMVGDATSEADVLKLFGDERADMVFTDPPYRLAYLKKGGEAKGFGQKRDRRYLGTDELPEDFTARWMANAAKVQAASCHVVVYENWKNIREIWGEMEKFWKVRNMIVWHAPNRSQGASPKYSLYSKHDVALVGGAEEAAALNEAPEEEVFQNEYETALHAVSGKPHWEGYGAGQRHCPTDFVEHNVANFRSSGQGVVFGAKPIEILIPYIKVMTERGGVVYEPFGGSGSTLVACEKLGRRCFAMEKCPAYAEVIRRRWERVTGEAAALLD
ncbi:MAG TPA: DNA methyltransferase [Candidatus Paceibacterota bacterium]